MQKHERKTSRNAEIQRKELTMSEKKKTSCKPALQKALSIYRHTHTPYMICRGRLSLPILYKFICTRMLGPFILALQSAHSQLGSCLVFWWAWHSSAPACLLFFSCLPLFHLFISLTISTSLSFLG